MFSPAQVAIGSFVGGPIALACFVRSNYIASGDASGARRTAAAGVLLVLAWCAAIALGLLLEPPAPILPGILLAATPFALVVAAYRIVQRQIASHDHRPAIRSNARVAGIAALCFLASGICALVTIVVTLVAILATSGFRT